jgi:endonuclease-3 related protein
MKADIPPSQIEKKEISGDLLMGMYDLMLERFGRRNWWPGDTPLEVCVGAILTQNTSWKNVAKAIENLKAQRALEAGKLHELEISALAEMIRPAGYYNVKARRLKNFIERLWERWDGRLDRLFDRPIADLREELLTINGIGPETADSIILYAAKKPVFVIDAYTKRVLTRHKLATKDTGYDEMQALFHDNLTPDEPLFNDFHAQFVAIGHHYCKPTPRCEKCPLNGVNT